MESYLVLPEDLWTFILNELALLPRFGLVSVSTTWKKVIYNSVTSLSQVSSKSDHCLQFFRRFPSLTELDASRWPRMTDQQLRELTDPAQQRDDGSSPLTRLRSLVLQLFPAVTDEGLSALTGLTSLDLTRNMFVRLSTATAKRLTKLTSLSLAANGLVSDGALQNFSTQLTSLNLTSNSAISDSSLMQLANLKRLILAGNDPITSNTLGRLTSLTFLDVREKADLEDYGINSLTSLVELELQRNKFLTDDALKPLTNLERLYLGPDSRIGDNGISGLVNLKDLSILYSMFSRMVSDAGLCCLTGLTSLQVRNCDSSVRALLFGKSVRTLTNLRSLSLITAGRFEDDDLSGLVELEDLLLEARGMLTDASMTRLTNLTRLSLKCPNAISETALELLKRNKRRDNDCNVISVYPRKVLL